MDRERLLELLKAGDYSVFNDLTTLSRRNGISGSISDFLELCSIISDIDHNYRKIGENLNHLRRLTRQSIVQTLQGVKMRFNCVVVNRHISGQLCHYADDEIREYARYRSIGYIEEEMELEMAERCEHPTSHITFQHPLYATVFVPEYAVICKLKSGEFITK